MPSAKPLRYAHCDGQTNVCYHEDGKHLLTSGDEGEVRIWDGFDDEDSVSHRVGERVFALICMKDRFFTSTDIFTIQAFTYPDGAPDGILTRFTAPVHHMVVNKTGKTLVAGSSDFTIKITDVETCSHKTCQGHEAPVLSVALDPEEEFLASSSCDGTVRVWRVDDQSLVTTLNILPKTNDVSFSKTLCRLSWDFNKGEVIYIPVEKEIQIYQRSNWKLIGCMKDDSVAGVLSVLSLSTDGKYLAAGSSEGSVLVFDVNTKECVDRFSHPKKLSITSIAWNPKQLTELAFCDNMGQFGLLEDISLKSTKSSNTGEVRAKETIGLFDDDDDDLLMTEDATADDDIDTRDDNVDDGDDLFSKKIKPLPDLDDENSKQMGSDVDDRESIISDLIPAAVYKPVIEGFKPTPLQASFQAGSTPVHLTSRFMVWNSVGMVKQYNNEEENSVDIEFHDTSIHHAMHITNTSNYTMADVSTEAVVLACRADEETPSKLLCMHFGSWDSCKEWTLPMPDGEEIMAVTLGEDWVAVATDKRNVRLFSIGGVQKEMFTLPGPVVCLSAHTNQLMAVYHMGMGIPGDQCLGVTLMCVEGKQRNTVSGQPLPLSAKATLSWLGFSAEGTPFYMESTGIVRMFNRKFGPSWIQVANTKTHVKGKSDHYWIVGINENPQQLRCIPCKGSKYPPTLPRPAVSLLPFQIPFCEMSVEKSQYEESLWRTRLFGQHFDHWSSQGFDFEETMKNECLKSATESLMKLFALSARSDREFRALEVCEMMTEQHTLQLAIKYASRVKHMQLAERISELAQRRAEEEAYKVEEEEEVEETYNTAAKWRNRNGHRHTEDEDEEEVMDEGEDVMVEEEEEEENTSSGPMLNLKPKEEKASRPQFLSSARSNPFKVATPQKTSTAGSKGTQIFDSMSRKSKPKVTSPPVVIGKPAKDNIKHIAKKTGSIGKLFPAKNKTQNTKTETTAAAPSGGASAFDLWFEENKTSLEEEHPDLSEEDLIKEGTDRFRELPKEEKQVWLQKSKLLKTDNTENEDSADNKKRKREEDVHEAKELSSKKKKESILDSKKKPLSQSTNSKLSGFAFQKE